MKRSARSYGMDPALYKNYLLFYLYTNIYRNCREDNSEANHNTPADWLSNEAMEVHGSKKGEMLK